jgi:hypothetical protein
MHFPPWEAVTSPNWRLLMANYYTETSCILEVPKEKMEQADKIILRVITEIEKDADLDEGGYFGCEVDTIETGFWFYSCNANLEHIAEVAKAVIEELELDKPFYCSWANYCSKPRLDSFGGGAFVVAKGMDTFWVDSLLAVQREYEDRVNGHIC